MSHHVHKMKAFMLELEDRPGGLARATADLKAHGINLRALWGWVMSEGVAQAVILPDEPDKVSGCGCDTCGTALPVTVLWLEDEDATGAFDANLQTIAQAGVSLMAVSAAAIDGRYGALIMFKQEADADRVLTALGECCA